MNPYIELGINIIDTNLLFRFDADPFDTAKNQTVNYYSDTLINIQSDCPMKIKHMYSFENQMANYGILFNAYTLGLQFEQNFKSKNELLKNLASLLDNMQYPMYALFEGSYSIRKEKEIYQIFKHTDQELKSDIYKKVTEGFFNV